MFSFFTSKSHPNKTKSTKTVDNQVTGGKGSLRIARPTSSPAKVDLVLIPGICTPGVETWPFYDKLWLEQCLPGQSAHVRVLAFSYKLKFSATFSWSEGWDYARALLEELREAKGDASMQKAGSIHPTFFVCHSLGGILLKQAVCLAAEEPEIYGGLQTSISGIIFMSTPHFEGPSVNKFIDIVRATTKDKIRLSTEREKEESELLSELSVKFEAIVSAPVLFMYESQATQIQTAKVTRKKILLVDGTDCTTLAKKDRCLAVPLDHMSSCHFHTTSGSCSEDVITFVNAVLSNAEEDLMSILKSRQYTYTDTTPNYTPTNSSIGESKANQFDQARRTGISHLAITAEVPFESDEPVAHLLGPCHSFDFTAQKYTCIGREDVLQQLAEALLPSSKTSLADEPQDLKQFAVCGLGGLGKTEIAIEFVLRNKAKFDAVFWVDSADEVKLDACYTQIAANLALETRSDAKNQVVSRTLVKTWLTNPKLYMKGTKQQDDVLPMAKWLVVFDNADSPQTLLEYWPKRGGSILITSRDPHAKYLTSAEPLGIDLEPLSEVHGSSLLRKVTDETGDDESASEIAKRLGGLPFAIVQAAGFMNRQGLTFSEFLEAYEDESHHASLIGQNLGPVVDNMYLHAISAVWAFEGLRPWSSRLLQTLAFLDPDHVRETHLTHQSVCKIKGFPPTLTSFNKAKNELIQGSLIKRQRDKNEISLHRLVQDAIKAQMSAEDQKSLFWAVVELIEAQWPTGIGPPTSRVTAAALPKLHFVERWPLCEALYPHVRRLRHLYRSIGPKVLGTPNFILARLLADAAQWQFERGKLEEFDEFWEIALEICSQTQDPGRDSLLVDINFVLGVIASESNKHEAGRSHKESALRLQEVTCRTLEVKDTRLARCHGEFGVALIHSGEYDKAIEEIKKALAIDKELNTSRYFFEINIGLAYILKGDIGAAEEVLTKALAQREATYGWRDDVDVASGRLLHAMGNLRAAQNQEAESFKHHLNSLIVLEATVGKHHYRTADLHHIVANHYYLEKSYDKALIHVKEALRIYDYEPSLRKRERARSSFLRSRILRALGQVIGANVFLNRAKHLHKEMTDPNGDSTGAELTEQDFNSLVTFWSR